MLEFFHPPSLNQQPELMQGHPESISATMPCHERAGKFRWKNISENISSIGSLTLKRKKAAFVLSNKMFFSTIELSFTMDLIEKKT